MNIVCPKCGKEDVEVKERGVKVGRGLAVGLILTPFVGVAVGMIGRHKLISQCNNCGKRFKHEKE